MSSTDIESLIERHREEVDVEIEKLRPAAEEYDRLVTYREGMGKPPSARKSTRARRAPSGGGGGNASSNADRPKQFMEALMDKPEGLSIAEIAGEIGDVSSNYLYRVRDTLVSDGMVEKQGQKHVLTEKGAKEARKVAAAA